MEKCDQDDIKTLHSEIAILKSFQKDIENHNWQTKISQLESCVETFKDKVNKDFGQLREYLNKPIDDSKANLSNELNQLESKLKNISEDFQGKINDIHKDIDQLKNNTEEILIKKMQGLEKKLQYIDGIMVKGIVKVDYNNATAYIRSAMQNIELNQILTTGFKFLIAIIVFVLIVIFYMLLKMIFFEWNNNDLILADKNDLVNKIGMLDEMVKNLQNKWNSAGSNAENMIERLKETLNNIQTKFDTKVLNFEDMINTLKEAFNDNQLKWDLELRDKLEKGSTSTSFDHLILTIVIFFVIVFACINIFFK